MKAIPFTVSFDALATLIQITNGVGYQYRTAFSTFLKQHNIDLDASCPSASNEHVERVALAAIRAEMSAERATWTKSPNPKEAPSGGDSDESLERFWFAVFARTFQNPALYEGAAPEAAAKIQRLWSADAEAMRSFTRYLVFDLFGSTKTHSWLPEGLRTLQSLRAWNRQQREKLRLHGNKSTQTDAPATGVLALAAPPFVVSNMDPRVRSVFGQLGALSPSGDDGEPPLLSRVIVARDVGFAKPSPVGLVTGVRDIASTLARDGEWLGSSVPQLEMRRHIHVGDAEADRVACEKAGCVYVKCDPTVGVTWEQLRAAIASVEASHV